MLVEQRIACKSSRTAKSEVQGLREKNNINTHWSIIKNALYSTGLVNCGLARRIVTRWISGGFFEALQSISGGNEYNEPRLVTRREFNTSLPRDREVWWCKCALEIEHADTMENFRKLFHFIQATSKKALSVSRTTSEADSRLIHNLQRRLVRLVEHFKPQFS